MKSGHGRLILRDGTDLPIGYRLVYNEFGRWCSGTLIGNIRSIDPGSFSEVLTAQLDDDFEIRLLVTGHSERHVSFVAEYQIGALLDRGNSSVETA